LPTKVSNSDIKLIFGKLDKHYEMLVGVDKKVAVIEEHLRSLNGSVAQTKKDHVAFSSTVNKKLQDNSKEIESLKIKVGKNETKWNTTAGVLAFVASLIGGFVAWVASNLKL